MSAAGMPPIDDPAHDGLAVELGKIIMWERAQLPPVVLGRCEHGDWAGAPLDIVRCGNTGILVSMDPRYEGGIFLCPKHGATLERAVRRWPR